MAKQDNLKDIEKLKQANVFLETLFASINDYKSKEGTSFPIGIPYFGYRDEHQINYNEMCIDILEHFVEKLGDKKELRIGKYLTCWLDIIQTKIRIGFSLSNEEVEPKLYDRIFGSWSTIYTWFENHVLPLLTLITPRYVNFEDIISFFEHIGTDVNSKERCLAWDASTYDKAGTEAKKIIDNIFNLSEDKELLKDIDEVLDVYFDKVFKYNKEEY